LYQIYDSGKFLAVVFLESHHLYVIKVSST
jgi:hypothetical protein